MAYPITDLRLQSTKKLGKEILERNQAHNTRQEKCNIMILVAFYLPVQIFGTNTLGGFEKDHAVLNRATLSAKWLKSGHGDSWSNKIHGLL